MASSNISARKGSTFEREIAKKLSLWASSDKDPYIFARRAGSGGSFRDKHGHTNNEGDIFADKPEGKWLTNKISFELKFYKELTGGLWNFICSKSSKIDDFINQSQQAASTSGKAFLLIMKCNNRDTICITNLNPDSIIFENFRFQKFYQSECLYMFTLNSMLKVDPIKFKSWIHTVSYKRSSINEISTLHNKQ